MLPTRSFFALWTLVKRILQSQKLGLQFLSPELGKDLHRSSTHTAPSVYPPHYVSPTRLLTTGKAFLAREHQIYFIHVSCTDSHYPRENCIVHKANALLLDLPVEVMHGLYSHRNG